MKKSLWLLCLVVALAGCETSPAQKVDIKSLPEYQEHMGCLAGQAARYSKVQGSALELGIIGSSACNSTRANLFSALEKLESRAYAQGYIGASEREEPKILAAAIIKRRGY